MGGNAVHARHTFCFAAASSTGLRFSASSCAPRGISCRGENGLMRRDASLMRCERSGRQWARAGGRAAPARAVFVHLDQLDQPRRVRSGGLTALRPMMARQMMPSPTSVSGWGGCCGVHGVPTPRLTARPPLAP
jgi:hypothetical protein